VPTPRFPTGFLQYIPWLRIFHKGPIAASRFFRFGCILCHLHGDLALASFARLTPPTLPAYERCQYCLRRRLHLHCACRQPLCPASEPSRPRITQFARVKASHEVILPRSQEEAPVSTHYRPGSPVFGRHRAIICRLLAKTDTTPYIRPPQT
jgi:hypothetical protein